MKPAQIIILIIVAIVIIAAIFYFVPFKRESSGGEFVVEISNNTNTVKLEIPKGALPTGISEQDISIFKIEPNDNAGLIGLKLQPSGIEFSKPVTISITTDVDRDKNFAPILIHQSGEGKNLKTEIIKDLDVTFDRQKSRRIVKGKISHFSEIWMLRELFFIEVATISETNVGEEFEYGVIIIPTHEVLRFVDANKIIHTYEYNPGSFWAVGESKFTTEYREIITPTEARFRWGNALEEHASYVERGVFFCDEEGEESIGTHKNNPPEVSLTVLHTIEEITGDVKETKNLSIAIRVRDSHTCTDEPMMVRVCPIISIVCESTGEWYNGYYECDPITGEAINDILLDLDTKEPLITTCP